MIKLLIMYPKPANPEHFKRHYLEHHLPLCAKIPGALRMNYTFEPETVQGTEEWFCIFEMECRDRDALNAALATSESRAAAADVKNYSVVKPTCLIIDFSEVGVI